MKYNSTRSENYRCTSAEAIKQGLAPDGGLFVPESFPGFSLEEIKDFSNMTYQHRAVKILGRFLTDFAPGEIEECVAKAYNKDSFATESITPVYKLGGGIYFLELWHGVTCAFKDLALQILPHLLTKSLKKTGDERTAVILVATSGDTGKAALEGFSDVEGTKIAVFYPRDGVSDIQKLQMTTQKGSNVTVSGIKGNFDDAQSGVKKIFTDKEFISELDKRGYTLSSANSINWGRLVPQIVYYFSAYADMLHAGELSLGEKVNFVVPTGNFGDILAGYYAKLLGLPVNKLVCASNKNNVLTDFIKTGEYNKNRQFYTTHSPSMDILISSNLERFIYNMADNNPQKTKEYMDTLASDGKYTVSDEIKEKMQQILWGGCCDDEATAQAIKETFEQYGYVMDTHTAVGKKVCDEYLKQTGDKTKTVVLSTASPFKFNGAVLSAIKGEEAIKNKTEFELLDMLSEISGLVIPKGLSELKNDEIRFPGYIEKEDMKGFVSEFNK